MADTYQAVYDAVRARVGPCDPNAAFESAANLQLGGFSYIPQQIQQEVYRVSEAMTAPHVLMRPSLGLDGTMWCALYGENLMDGVAGFGETPALAMSDFDKNWHEAKTPAAIRKAAQ